MDDGVRVLYVGNLADGSRVRELNASPGIAEVVTEPDGASVADTLSEHGVDCIACESGFSDIDALGVVVEAASRFPDPAAATTLIETAIEPITGLTIETDSLLEQAEEIRATRQQLARQMQQAREESSKAEPVGMYQ
mgnify:CR=1 FL=1